MLFLNRRGYAPPHLPPVRLERRLRTLRRLVHLAPGRAAAALPSLRQRAPLPHHCPECGSNELIGSGVGTEQLEQLLTTIFPQYPVVRIDRDNTRRKGSWSPSRRHQGGQVQDPDRHPDAGQGPPLPGRDPGGSAGCGWRPVPPIFGSREAGPALHTQVAGRAGRASKPGLVVLQSHHPEHALLQDLTQNG